jgi:mannose-1-phosphate guanylyltransferase/mannose-6-phosphate isomerase
MLIPVILSGGAGTRLWPVSREAFPKPFIRMADGESLIEKTLKRALNIPGVESVLTVTNQEYFFQTRDAFASNDSDFAWHADWLLEPASRNTAPAIAAAALHIMENYSDKALMLVMPADHLISNINEFNLAVDKAKVIANQGYLVTFGIRPSSPEPGFGYIEAGENLTEGFLVSRFIEKPGIAKAIELISQEQYHWNSGMFCMRVDIVLEELRKHTPNLLEIVEKSYRNGLLTNKPILLDDTYFVKAPNISFDYAVMEKTDKAAVIIAEFDWNDVGSWESMSSLDVSDEDGNISQGENIILESNNCYLRSSDRLIAVLGLKDIFIIDTPDALLVANRNNLQQVKQVVAELKKQDHPLYRLHQTVYRPWGSYTILEDGDRFKIKRIIVKPGQRLSSQMHYHRNEHWIIVSGTAKISNGENEQILLTNQSTYIEAGVKHRLENPGIKDLVLIEVQSGEYLGEDDIVRYEDIYGRV